MILEKAKRVFVWISCNALMATSLWFGFVDGVAGFLNIGLFMAWVAIAFSFVAGTKLAQAELRKKGRSVPQMVSVTPVGGKAFGERRMSETLPQALCIIYVSTDDGKTWLPVKPEDVPADIKHPDTIANMLAGECAQLKDFPLAWYRAERVDSKGETLQ